MARTAKNLTKKSKVSKLITKVKSMVGGKKVTQKRAITNIPKKGQPVIDLQTDPAHSPGHRRLSLKSELNGSGKSGRKMQMR